MRPLFTGLSPRVRGNPLSPPRPIASLRSIPACAGEPSPRETGPPYSTVYPRVCGGTPRAGPALIATGGLSPRVRGNQHGVMAAAKAIGSIPACAGEPSRSSWRGVMPGVYPRVCGGTKNIARLSMPVSGLSPRVRGNLGQIQPGRADPGSIPACAGEPSRSERAWELAEVYPRVCGGTDVRNAAGDELPGLSPRVRGNRQHLIHDGRIRGSIPACAGEPWRSTSSARPPQVYPRVCGGTRCRASSRRADWGLSPRVRGNPGECPSWWPLRRSIPACAGEPRWRMACARPRRVYPRVCGGTSTSSSSATCIRGLSPRVRGNRLAAAPARARAGSIPACAGEPCRAAGRPPLSGVYPRVCGGTDLARDGGPGDEGLSPRVRGNPPGRAAIRAHGGSIPACAGEPRRRTRPAGRHRVYPRVCGGTKNGIIQWAGREGLSPRVRGNPGAALPAHVPPGSIPACAGEPRGARHPPRGAWVYPRVCGGTLRARRFGAALMGLSPRVRGNLTTPNRPRPAPGSIPACAGEPANLGPRFVHVQVYPRVCGGTRVIRLVTVAKTGLSPRVRGNL